MKTCRNCWKFKSCAKAMKRLGVNPDDPNNEAIRICAVYHSKEPLKE